MKKVEIVFPVHNRRDITVQCLRSLARIEKINFAVHVVLVDDGSTDGTREAVEREFPDVEIIGGDGNLWFTEGTNVAVRAALKHNPDFILMMNDDQVFDSKFLVYMLETAEKYPRSVVGPLLLLWDTPHKLFQVSPRWETLSGGWRHWHRQTVWTIPAEPWSVEIIVGNCLLLPVQAIVEVGLMNSKRYPNFGDAEYTPRLRKKNWNLLIDPRARVFCQPNNIPAKIREMDFKTKLNALWFDLRNIHDIRRRFYSNIDGAPQRWKGVMAFAAYFITALLKRNPENLRSAIKPEKELKETVAAPNVKD